MVAEVTSVWSAHGVSPAIQNALLDKLAAGEALDANLGVAPVSTSSTSGAEEVVQVNTFADGSISVITTEVPTPAPAPGQAGTMSLQGCSVSGLTFSNCTSSGWYTGVQLAYLVSYQLNPGNYAYFISYSSPSVQCSVGLSCGSPYFSMVKQYQDGSSSSAAMNLSTTWTVTGIGGTGTTFHWTYLRAATAWTS